MITFDLNLIYVPIFERIRDNLPVTVKSAENRDITVVTPIVVVSHVPSTIDDPTVSGEMPRVSGYIEALIVIEEGVHAGPATAIASQIAALFPIGHRMQIDSGLIEFRRHAQIMRGYPYAGFYNLPVRLYYTAA